ncbi:hypothetical protein INT47_006895 [Mucor saturninus]|uniref:Uncharacterized protein n=1 Tax=Mucor saturninus TaxID=64648 RepID=A0A8H7RBT5_9FUNG|nr:hypothetical protein INT47_006895 [Mucor saturninus]
MFKNHYALVKTLEFGNYVLPMKYGKGMSLFRLFSNLSQLKVIDLRRRKDAPTILCALKSALDDCPRSMRDLQHVIVSTINDPLADEQIKTTYYGVCYKRRQCITHLNVYPKDAIHIGYLRDYPSLTHVYIYNSDAWKVRDEERDRLLFAKVLRMCPNLIELEILNSPTFNYLRADKPGPRSEYPVPTLCESSGPLKMYNPKLRHLRLTLESFDVGQMEYMMTYIPAHRLDGIILHLSQHNTLKEWIKDKRAKSTLTRFIQHVCKSKKFRLQIDTKYSEKEEDPTGEQVLDVNTLLWSNIARTIEESRKVDDCHIKLTLTHNPSSYEVHPYMQSAAFLNKCNLCFDVSVRHHALVIRQCLEYSDFFHQNGADMATVHHLMEPTSRLLSYWNPHRFIEDATRVLHLSVPEPYLIQAITFAFVNFPNVVSLEIDTNANGDNIEHCQGISCARVHDAYFENEDGRFGLYKLQLNNAALTGPLIDRIGFLLRYIYELVIHDGIVYDNKVTYNRIKLDFTQMTHLKKVTLNFQYVLQRYSNTLVQIKRGDDVTTYRSFTRNRKHGFVEVSDILVDIEPESGMVKPRITILITFPEGLQSLTFGQFKDTVSD